MNNQLLQPVCMVVGRDNVNFRHLQRELGSRAAFFSSTEAQCLPELVKSGADVVVVLWSSTARQCAQAIHRNYPQARVILEGNRTSLPGRPEKNGFLSVMEKSQSRSELVRAVEAALEDCEKSPETPSLRQGEGKLDSNSFIGRLSSLPVVSGDIQRTADHLLESFLSAVKSGCGGLFLQDAETGEYVPVSVRNLPPTIHSLRIAPSSKLIPLLAGGSAPIQLQGGGPATLLRGFAAQAGGNVILPLLLEGSLHGWFVLLISEPMAEAEAGILTSMGFFAAETLRESYSTLEARRKSELSRVFLTKVTDALAWIKPDGELNIIHDANRLIAVRSAHDTTSFSQLASSVLKEAIHAARQGNPGPVNFRQKGTGVMLHGKTTCLEDGSVILSLSAEHEAGRSLHAENGPRGSGWKDFAETALSAQTPSLMLLPDAAPIDGVVQKIRQLFSGEARAAEPLASVFETMAPLFSRFEINDPANLARAGAVGPKVAAAALLLALSLRLKQDARPSLKISLSDRQATLQIQIDLPHEGNPLPSSEASAAQTLEYVAMEGWRSAGGALVYRDSAFGSRWEMTCQPVAADKKGAVIIEMPKPIVLHKVLNVLQDQPSPLNQIGDELLHG